MTLRLTCLIFIILFISSVSFAQDCDGYIGILRNNSGEDMYAFASPTSVFTQLADRQLTIDGIIVDTSLIIILNVNHGAPFINQEDDIVIKFTDRTVIRLKSTSPANCNHQAALTLRRTSVSLEYFKSKEVSSIKIETSTNDTKGDRAKNKLVTD
jgi:hypothetical protein